MNVRFFRPLGPRVLCTSRNFRAASARSEKSRNFHNGLEAAIAASSTEGPVWPVCDLLLCTDYKIENIFCAPAAVRHGHQTAAISSLACYQSGFYIDNRLPKTVSRLRPSGPRSGRLPIHPFCGLCLPDRFEFHGRAFLWHRFAVTSTSRSSPAHHQPITHPIPAPCHQS